MVISNRRDAGYTIISRFEEAFRKYLDKKLPLLDPNYKNVIPSGIINKAKDRYGALEFDSVVELLENSDFPDLKEICLYNSSLKQEFKDKIGVNEFVEIMDELYGLRCKIAHIKGFFTSIDLDKLIELTKTIAEILRDADFLLLVTKILEDPESVIIRIPADFINDPADSGVINNIPVPDYEYEGGFVGREADRKKIIQYLNSEKFSVITITGAGGVGKTSLALRVIQEITSKPKYKPFDGIIWLSAKENKLSALGIEDIEPTLKSYEELLDTVIEVLNFGDECCGTMEEKEKLVETIIGISDKLLIVIDNLETITDQRIINFIIDSPLKVKFLITSRKGIGQVEIRHEVKQLKEKDAIYLFRQLAKDKQLNSLVSLKDEVIKGYVEKVSFYPLAIKWVIGQIARGKDINKVIGLIQDTESDISKFCFQQIFSSLSEYCKDILYAICCFDEDPTSSVLQYVVEQNDDEFDKSIEELILVSLLIPEQFQNEANSISRKFSMLSLTKGYVRLQLQKNPNKREHLTTRIIEVESTITLTEKAKKEYRHSLHNLGAKTDEEKVGGILAQAAFQKYQSGRYDEAVEDYKKAVKVAPNFSAIYRNWGVMESYEGHLQEADKLMEKAESLNGSDPQIYLLWGNILRKNGKFSEALSKYEMALKLDRNDHIVLNALGFTLGKLGYYERADKYLREALATPGFDSIKHNIIASTSIAENLINWSDHCIKDRNMDGARSKLTEALVVLSNLTNSNVSDPKIYSSLTKANLKKGLFHLKLNQKNEAEYYLKNAFYSTPKTIHHVIYVITAGIELAELKYGLGLTEVAKKYVSEIESQFNTSEILKKSNYQVLYGKLNEIRSKLSDTEKVKGTITVVNLDYNYVIITSERGGHGTFIANNDDFIPRLTLLSHELMGKAVFFNPVIRNGHKGEKRYAKFIKLV